MGRAERVAGPGRVRRSGARRRQVCIICRRGVLMTGAGTGMERDGEGEGLAQGAAAVRLTELSHCAG